MTAVSVPVRQVVEQLAGAMLNECCITTARSLLKELARLHLHCCFVLHEPAYSLLVHRQHLAQVNSIAMAVQ